MKFYIKAFYSENIIVQNIANRCLYQSYSNMGKNVTLLNQCFNLMGYLYQGKQIIVNHVNKMNVALNENIDDIITCEICTNR